jgi:hypothetical protein
MTQLFVDTLANEAGTGPTELTGQSAAKAWIKSSNEVVDNSFNISSGVDNGTGDYTFNFTNSFSSASQAVNSTGFTSGVSAFAAASLSDGTAFTVKIYLDDGSFADLNTASSIHGTLA